MLEKNNKTETQHLPKFIPSDGLSFFVADLRSHVFSSQTKTAQYFNLTHSTVSRYENGKLTPALGFIACLLQMIVERRREAGQPVEEQQRALLKDLNEIIGWYYAYNKPLQSWDEVIQLAISYRLKQRKTIMAASANNPVMPTKTSPMPVEYWNETIDVSNFYGRNEELAQLENWIVKESCRVVSLVGMGGIGKTCLSVKLAQQIKVNFDFVIWYSLHDCPTIEELLMIWVDFISGQEQYELPAGLDQKINLLLSYLRNSRCLLILDNVEAILQENSLTGEYLPGYEGYGRFFQKLGQSVHKSCLVLTSREKPIELDSLESKDGKVRSLSLKGLNYTEYRQILHDKELIGSDEHWQALVQIYSGNPSALKIMAGSIQKLFAGNIAHFLKEKEFFFGNVNLLLKQQLLRLSERESQIVNWLASHREAITLGELLTNMETSIQKKEILEALEALLRRSLIEKVVTENAFRLQAVILEYVTGTRLLVSFIPYLSVATVDSIS